MIQNVLRAVVPPAIWSVARRLKAHLSGHAPELFEGPFPSWQSAASRSTGWDAPEITGKTLAAALKVRARIAEFEQDSLSHKEIIYSPTILAFLFIALAKSQQRIDIIDFGGGLGSNYFQHRKLLNHLDRHPIRWTVIERPVFAKLGTELFKTAELSFYPTLEEDALSNLIPVPGALIFTGSLQYLAKPLDVLDQAISADISVLAIDRFLVSPTEEHAVYIQHPDPAVYYHATYPVWCFSRNTIIDWFSARGFMLVEHFTPNPDAYFDHAGMVFIKKADG